jgi:hypothetical protein
MERKQACTAYLPSRKVYHLNPPMNAIDQKKYASTALSTGTTQRFVLTWRNKGGLYHTAYKRSLMNTSNVADWSIVFYAYNRIKGRQCAEVNRQKIEGESPLSGKA